MKGKVKRPMRPELTYPCKGEKSNITKVNKKKKKKKKRYLKRGKTRNCENYYIMHIFFDLGINFTEILWINDSAGQDIYNYTYLI